MGAIDPPDDPGNPGVVAIPVEDVLDLHSFPPGEVSRLVRDWLDLAHAAGFREIRIVHGRGVGVQRRTVRTLLERDPRISGFGDAPPEAGGWGATWARFR